MLNEMELSARRVKSFVDGKYNLKCLNREEKLLAIKCFLRKAKVLKYGDVGVGYKNKWEGDKVVESSCYFVKFVEWSEENVSKYGSFRCIEIEYKDSFNFRGRKYSDKGLRCKNKSELIKLGDDIGLSFDLLLSKEKMIEVLLVYGNWWFYEEYFKDIVEQIYWSKNSLM